LHHFIGIFARRSMAEERHLPTGTLFSLAKLLSLCGSQRPRAIRRDAEQNEFLKLLDVLALHQRAPNGGKNPSQPLDLILSLLNHEALLRSERGNVAAQDGAREAQLGGEELLDLLGGGHLGPADSIHPLPGG
jgi:hypothetical protein